jgi:hypothetical protein
VGATLNDRAHRDVVGGGGPTPHFVTVFPFDVDKVALCGHAGISELKWCTNTFLPFLVIGAVPDLHPRARDAEGVFA